jgi:hypothetical protein
MAEIQLTGETKKKLLNAVAAGKGSDLLILGFPQNDPQFTAEIFRAAEKAENWLFIEHLRDVRAQQRGTIEAATPGKKQKNAQVDPKSKHHRIGRINQPNKFSQKYSGRNSNHQLPSAEPLNPATLQPHQVIYIQPHDYTRCPKCQTRLPKKFLQDHIEMACPKRGSVDVTHRHSSSDQQQGERPQNKCWCGACVIPGDSCCYDHKPT